MTVIGITDDSAIAGGKPRLAGHRITVQNIVIWHERLGMNADEIRAEYDLPLAGVYAALVYYSEPNCVARRLQRSEKNWRLCHVTKNN